MAWMDNPQNREQAKIEFEADHKAGKIMDKQDEIQREIEACEILKKLGANGVMWDNGTYISVDEFIEIQKWRIEVLDNRLKPLLDKLPKMKLIKKTYKIAED